MNKTFLIFKHEFLKTIKRTGFIILALSLPVLGLLGIGIFHIVSGITQTPTAVVIGYVDEAGDFDDFTNQGNINFTQFDTQEAATQALIKEDIKEFFIIPSDYTSTGIINRFITQRELSPPPDTTTAIKNFISSNLLAGKVSEIIVTRIEEPLNIVTTTLTSTGTVSPEQGGYRNFIIPGIFSFLMAFALLLSSIYVLQGLSEEKENRLIEILLSSVSTRQLITGKFLGLGAAGLVQVLIWVISIPLLLGLASSSIGGFIGTIQLSANFLIFGILYFILGYSVFALVSLSIASISSTLQEAQALSSIYTLFVFIPFWAFSLLLLYPNSPVWVVFTIFPFTAPVLTMLRLGLTGVPPWQLTVSIAVLILSIVGGLLLASKLLRTYLLMYGKRPGLKAIIRKLKRRES